MVIFSLFLFKYLSYFRFLGENVLFQDQPTPQHWAGPPSYPGRSDSDAPSHKRSRTSDQYGSLSDIAHAIPHTPIPAAAALPVPGIGEDEDPRQRTIKVCKVRKGGHVESGQRLSPRCPEPFQLSLNVLITLLGRDLGLLSEPLESLIFENSA